MDPRLTKFERSIRDQARARNRVRKKAERDAIIAMCIMGIAFGVSLVVMAEYRQHGLLAHVPRTSILVLDRSRGDLGAGKSLAEQ